MSKAPNLVFRQSRESDHLVVVLHGIRQDARGMTAFADQVAAHMPSATVAIFDYDWTQPISVSGAHCAATLRALGRKRVSLIGYSMGGLVARVAVADHDLFMVDTVITLATPNRGALTPAQLWPLGQELVEGLRFISPMAHCRGVLDLTDINEKMLARRALPSVRAAVASKRYASVPALYFHPDRPWRASTTKMGRAAVVLDRFAKLPRPHDGIVSEDKNCLHRRSSTDQSEFDLAVFDGRSPPRCHATHIAARELDHISVLESEPMAALVARLIATPDWGDLPKGPDMDFALA